MRSARWTWLPGEKPADGKQQQVWVDSADPEPPIPVPALGSYRVECIEADPESGDGWWITPIDMSSRVATKPMLTELFALACKKAHG